MTVFLLKYWKQFVVMIGCFMMGVYITHNHYSAVISDMKATQAESIAQTAKNDLQSFKDVANSIKESAASATIEKDNLDVKLSSISKQIKALDKQKPLPVDCKPDDGRMLQLKDAIESTNSAIR